ncbi:hypothetical protein MVEN_00348900 [Mycena venus]|uniref:DUF6534 domain-containing protein n=1 Tax=Mycena venus TaxID=2733690 RepID=A0A8H6YUA8_9AGAR|nr:hypothetical protein MVEN_00348900 [Mycena venus]
MAFVDKFVVAYGVQLASSWVNMMLYMLEIVMCLRYFQRGTFRPLPHKIGVFFILFFDTLCTMSVDANVFVTFLVFVGKDSFFVLATPSSINIFLTYSTAVIEQFFLCHLYFIITRKKVVSLGLVFLGLFHLGFSFAAAIMLVADPKNRLLFTITGVGAITCGINDLLIAACLGYELFKIRRSHSSQSGVLRRIFILSITSGAIVASTTLLMMILFLKGSIAFDFFFSCQGRVYALTLLFNFLSGTSSSSESTLGSENQNGNGMFSLNSKSGVKKPPASIYSNMSEDSLNKELPPLPGTPKLQIVTLTHSFASTPYSASSSAGVIWTPQTPRTPRTIIAAPYRVESLPH